MSRHIVILGTVFGLRVSRVSVERTEGVSGRHIVAQVGRFTFGVTLSWMVHA